MHQEELTRLSSLSLFEGRSLEQIDQLAQDGKLRVLRHREVLYRAGDEAHSFAVVVEGALKLVKSTPAGNDVIVFFATPADAVAALLMSKEKSVYPVSVIAMGDCTVLEIPRRTYNAIWVHDAPVLQKVNHILFARFGEMHEQKALVKAPLSHKVARQLVSLLERFAGNSETILPAPITRQEIADSVGATVESVIRIMSDWSRQGILKTSDQQIEILRMDKLIGILKDESKA